MSLGMSPELDTESGMGRDSNKVHISISGLQQLHHKSLVKNFTLKGNTEIADCDACAEAKLTRNLFSSCHAIKATAPGE